MFFLLTMQGLNLKINHARRNGGMADAHGSGPCEVKFMWVQVPFPALTTGQRINIAVPFVYLAETCI